ncbi:MAG: hypothetical protein ACEQSB_07600, partial [Undibacterium sp.]
MYIPSDRQKEAIIALFATGLIAPLPIREVVYLARSLDEYRRENPEKVRENPPREPLEPASP